MSWRPRNYAKAFIEILFAGGFGRKRKYSSWFGSDSHIQQLRIPGERDSGRDVQIEPSLQVRYRREEGDVHHEALLIFTTYFSSVFFPTT